MNPPGGGVTLKKFSDVIVENEATIFPDEAENIRYAGPSEKVNNYIWFNCDDYGAEMNENNCEKWRIIGLFKGIQKPDGSTEDLVKIIRADSIGNMAWDSKEGHGLNDWSNADLQISLNNDYLNPESGVYTSITTPKAITTTTLRVIEEVIWNLGGTLNKDLGGTLNDNNVTASQFYTAERGVIVSSGAQSTWDGYIGLMYPSDYGYATGGNSTDRSECLATVLFIWDKDIYKTDCSENDWLKLSSGGLWTLTPNSSYPYIVFNVHTGGNVGFSTTSNVYGVHPTLYLKSSVKIAGGNGSYSKPYILVP